MSIENLKTFGESLPPPPPPPFCGHRPQALAALPAADAGLLAMVSRKDHCEVDSVC